MRAMGLEDAAIKKPIIGVVSMKGEQMPCNITHGFQVEAAKEGIAEAGGTPREFTTISVSDGVTCTCCKLMTGPSVMCLTRRSPPRPYNRRSNPGGAHAVERKPAPAH